MPHLLRAPKRMVPMPRYGMLSRIVITSQISQNGMGMQTMGWTPYNQQVVRGRRRLASQVSAWRLLEWSRLRH